MAHFKDGDIEIEGLDELILACANLQEDAMKYIKDSSDKAGNVVLDRVKQKAPVKTGNLKSKLKLGKAKVSSKYPYRVFSKVTTAKGAAYMVPLELGHQLVYFGQETNAQVKPKPFLRPAADESKDEVANIIAAAMNEALDKFGGLK